MSIASVCDRCGLVIRDLDAGFSLAVVGYGCSCGGKFKKLRGYYSKLTGKGPFYLVKLPGRKRRTLFKADEIERVAGAIQVASEWKVDLSDLYGFVAYDGYSFIGHSGDFKAYAEDKKKKGYKLLVPEEELKVHWENFNKTFDGILLAVLAKEPMASLLRSEYSPLKVKLSESKINLGSETGLT